MKYRSIVDGHLRPRFEARHLDGITADDLACLVRELRTDGKSEATIAVSIAVVGRIYKFAGRRLGWNGTSPTTLMLSSERPKISQAKRRPIFIGEQLEQTIAAERDPFRTLFAVAALTGARISELCALAWADVRIDDLDEAEIEFGWQVDRRGNRRPTKTDGSARTVPIPQGRARVLARHKRAAGYCGPTDFVFATGTGRTLQQRNVARALREAQKRAVDANGRPTGMQGGTVERAFVVAAPHELSRGWSYTALSRLRGQTRLFAITDRQEREREELAPGERQERPSELELYALIGRCCWGICGLVSGADGDPFRYPRGFPSARAFYGGLVGGRPRS